MLDGGQRSIPVRLWPLEEPPTQAEIDAVLMTVDALPGKLERKDIVFILKGSRRGRALFNQWYRMESYAALRHLRDDMIVRIVDYCIRDGWLQLAYDQKGKLLAYFDAKGWDRIKQIWARRVQDWLRQWAEQGVPEDAWPRLQRIHLQIKTMVIDRLRERNSADLVPLLRTWAEHEQTAEVQQALADLLADSAGLTE